MQYDPNELIHRVEEAARGGRPLTESILRQVVDELAGEQRYADLNVAVQDLDDCVNNIDGDGTKLVPKAKEWEQSLDKVWDDLARASSGLAGLIEDDSWTPASARSLHDRLEKVIKKFTAVITDVVDHVTLYEDAVEGIREALDDVREAME